MKNVRLLPRASALTSLLIVAGCATHLYDAERHKTAQTVEATYKDANVTEVLNPEYENQKKLRALEWDAVYGLRNAQWNAQLAMFLNPAAGPGNRAQDLEIAIACRINYLVPAPSSSPKEACGPEGPPLHGQPAQQAPIDTRASLQTLKDYFVLIKAAEPYRTTLEYQRQIDKALKNLPGKCEGIDVPLFDVASITPKDAGAASSPSFAQACRDLKKAVANLKAAQPSTGALRRQLDAVENWLVDREGLRRGLVDVKARVEKAEADVIAARKASERGEVGAEKTFNEALDKALGEIKKVNGTELGAKFLADRRLEAIQTFLDDLKAAGTPGSTQPSDGEKESAAAILALVPALIDDINAFQRSRAAPPPPHLLLEQDRQRILKADAERALRRADRLFALEQEKARALLSEAELLADAWANYRDFAGDPTTSEFSRRRASVIATVLSQKSKFDAVQAGLDRALVLYMQSVAIGQARYDQAEMDQFAVKYEEALDKSTANIAAWDSLIRVPLASLSVYFGTGITPSQIGELIQLGILGIIAGRI